MLLFILLGILLGLYLLVPKGTALHEVLRLPAYNYKAQTTPRDNMQMERHVFGKHRKQYLYFFGPKKGIAPKQQVIIYYHGGGWTFGTPMMFRCHAQLLVDQGYYVIMPSYRRLPFYRCSAMQEDAKLALKKTVEILADKALQDRQIVLSGLSAGGHLAALLAYDQQALQDVGIAQERLVGLLLLAPPLDLSKMALTPVLWRLAGWPGSALFRASNPINYVTKDDPRQVLILHGTKDGLVNYKSSLSFVEKRGSQRLTFYTIDNGTHLDAGNWIFEKNKTQTQVLQWLEDLHYSSLVKQ